MADRFIPSCIQVNIFGRYQDLTDLEHVIHVRSPITPVDYDTVADVADRVSQWCTNSYKAILPTDIHFTRIVATAIDRVNGPQAEVVNNTAGTVVGDIAPPQQTLCLKKAGTTRGRRRRGRLYVWPTILGDTAGGLFAPGYVAGALTRFNALLADLDTNGTPLVIGSLTDEAMWDVSTFVAVDRAVDGQSRRGIGRGR